MIIGVSQKKQLSHLKSKSQLEGATQFFQNYSLEALTQSSKGA